MIDLIKEPTDFDIWIKNLLTALEREDFYSNKHLYTVNHNRVFSVGNKLCYAKGYEVSRFYDVYKEHTDIYNVFAELKKKVREIDPDGDKTLFIGYEYWIKGFGFGIRFLITEETN